MSALKMVRVPQGPCRERGCHVAVFVLFFAVSLATAQEPVVLAVSHSPPFLIVNESCVLGQFCSVVGTPDAPGVYFGPWVAAPIFAPHMAGLVDLRVIPEASDIEVGRLVNDGTAAIGYPINRGKFVERRHSWIASEPVYNSSVVVMWFPDVVIRPMTMILSDVFDTWPYFVSLFCGALGAGFLLYKFENGYGMPDPRGQYKAKTTRCDNLEGMLKGAWFAVVTATTVGYGDKNVYRFESRVFSIFWTVAGLVLMTMLIGDFTGTLNNLSTMSAMDWLAVSDISVGVRVQTGAHLGVLTAGLPSVREYKTYGELCDGLVSTKEIASAVLDYDAAVQCIHNANVSPKQLRGLVLSAVDPQVAHEIYAVLFNRNVVAASVASNEFLELLRYAGRHRSRGVLGTANAPQVTIQSTPFKLTGLVRFGSSLILMLVLSVIGLSLGGVAAWIRHALARDMADAAAAVAADRQSWRCGNPACFRSNPRTSPQCSGCGDPRPDGVGARAADALRSAPPPPVELRPPVTRAGRSLAAAAGAGIGAVAAFQPVAGHAQAAGGVGHAGRPPPLATATMAAPAALDGTAPVVAPVAHAVIPGHLPSPTHGLAPPQQRAAAAAGAGASSGPGAAAVGAGGALVSLNDDQDSDSFEDSMYGLQVSGGVARGSQRGVQAQGRASRRRGGPQLHAPDGPVHGATAESPPLYTSSGTGLAALDIEDPCSFDAADSPTIRLQLTT